MVDVHDAFAELAGVLLVCAVAGALFVRLRQPVLIAYIVVGILLGPAVFGIVSAQDQIDLLAQLGVAILLFTVGIKLDLHQVRHIGPVALATGLGQLGFTIAIGFAIVLALGKGVMEAIYVAVALTFSSTIIIVKLLSDKRELDSLHGRIAVGFLIVQDAAVVIAMMAMSAMRGTGSVGDAIPMLDVLLSLAWRLGLAAVLIVALMRWMIPAMVALMARSQELLLVFAIAWGVALAALGEWAGFSKEAGAFLAGFSLASTPYREAISGRLTGVRDFLLLFFFIDLGARLELSSLGAEIVPAIVLSLFVLIGNPLIVMAIMGWMGYRKRTGFLAGLTVAQISEFSVVFVAMGVSFGHVGIATLGLTTLVGLITIAASTYMIVYSHPLYELLAPWLGWLERRSPLRETGRGASMATDAPEVLVVGLGRYGSRVLEQLHKAGVSVAGFDFDPQVVRDLAERGLPVRFGDGEDPGMLESLPLRQAAWVVTTLPLWESNRALLHGLNGMGFGGSVAGVARDAAHADALTAAGATWVLNPFDDAADRAAERLAGALRPETSPVGL